MDVLEYIEKEKNLQINLLTFIDNDDNAEKNFQKLIALIDDHHIREDRSELINFLRLILIISTYHIRSETFSDKINKIIHNLKNDIQQNFSDIELLELFEKDQPILLFLIKDEIIPKKSLYDYIKTAYSFIYTILNQFSYELYFFYELEEFFSDKEKEKMHEKLKKHGCNDRETFENVRKKGENDSYICKLIRADSIDEFIVYINKENIPLSNQIRQAFFETNGLLKRWRIDFIQYAAFYGSVRIFQYLLLNGIKLNSEIWQFAIHSKNAEIIQILVDNNIKAENGYIKYYEEAVKCHHNDIANYIYDNFIQEKFYSNVCFKVFNYSKFPENLSEINNFTDLCEFKYINLVKLLLNTKIDVNSKIDRVFYLI